MSSTSFSILPAINSAMDGLSLVASIAGIVQASIQISQILSGFISAYKVAPRELVRAKTEVDSLNAIVEELQGLILRTVRASKKGESLLLVERVAVTLTACIMTLSQLDGILEGWKVEGVKDGKGRMGSWDRVKWVGKMGDIEGLIGKLQLQKASLGLMVTILTWFVTSWSRYEDVRC
jgi:hypothetical protein